jgi:hypothetical protein
MLRHIGKLTNSIKKSSKISHKFRNITRNLRTSVAKFEFSESSEALSEFRGVNRKGFNFGINDNFGNFKVLDKTELKDYSMNLSLMKHETLGLHWFHFDSSDLDNSFTLIFRTLPDDNSGKPHILEHTGNLTF